MLLPFGPQSSSGKLCFCGTQGLLVTAPSRSLCFSASLTRLKTLGQALSFILVHIVPGTEWVLKRYLFTERLRDRSEGVSWHLGSKYVNLDTHPLY